MTLLQKSNPSDLIDCVQHPGPDEWDDEEDWEVSNRPWSDPKSNPLQDIQEFIGRWKEAHTWHTHISISKYQFESDITPYRELLKIAQPAQQQAQTPEASCDSFNGLPKNHDAQWAKQGFTGDPSKGVSKKTQSKIVKRSKRRRHR